MTFCNKKGIYPATVDWLVLLENLLDEAPVEHCRHYVIHHLYKSDEIYFETRQGSSVSESGTIWLLTIIMTQTPD